MDKQNPFDVALKSFILSVAMMLVSIMIRGVVFANLWAWYLVQTASWWFFVLGIGYLLSHFM